MGGRRTDGNDVIVGRKIRAHRLDRQMSQAGLAAAIGVTPQQVQKYETGANRVGSGRLAQIADALGVPVTALLAGAPDATRKTADAAPLAPIAKRQPLRLARAFAAIDDQPVRRALLAVAEQIAGLAQGRK